MKILHTSDWHIGRVLHARKRYDEFEAFFKWLLELIEAEKIDVLLVAGDVFDTSLPTNRAQEIYYQFLNRVARSCCRHVVVTGGNHDSPSFLDAPKGILRELNVHVTGAVTDDPADEVIVLKNREGRPEAVVCAVPYLRDRDIRTVEAGENVQDKARKLVEGMHRHYAQVCEIAEQRRVECGQVPLIAMGHLFAAGGKTIEGDGVRELYVGTLAQVGAELFPPSIDYLALGHLHIAQTVGGRETMRYCGSPVPMGFGEAGQTKKVVVVEFSGKTPVIREVPIPCFQVLLRVGGSLAEVTDRLEQLKREGSDAWLEVRLSGGESPAKVKTVLEAAVKGSALRILTIRNDQLLAGMMTSADSSETINDLSVEEVFRRCLDANEVAEADRPALCETFREALTSYHEKDANRE